MDHILAALRDNLVPTVEIYSILQRNLILLRRYQEGVAIGRKAIELAPRNYDFLNNLGVCLRRVGQFSEAIKIFDHAIKLRPSDATALTNKGNVYIDMANGSGAESIFSKLVRRDPRNSELQRQLGRALELQGKYDAACVRFRQAISIQRNNQDAWLDLSAATGESGHPDKVLEILETALEALPTAPRLIQAKLACLRKQGQWEKCKELLNELESCSDGTAWYAYERARLLVEVDRLTANALFRRAVELDPGNMEYRTVLIESLDRTRGDHEAENIEVAYRMLKDAPSIDALSPGQIKVATDILTRSADYEAVEAYGSFEKLGQRWATSGPHTAFLQHLPRVRTAAHRRQLVQQHKALGDRFIAFARRNPIQHAAGSRTDRKLRLGFMSSDLREHPVTSFAMPLFEHIDSDRFDVYCYSFFRGETASPLQRKLSSMVTEFRWWPSIGDHEAAQRIANDQLDMLFELGASTYMNKLEVMAWKPANLCASWLGYPHSAGLSTIDYLLVDPYLNPPDPSLVIEKPLVMPKTWIAMGELAFPDSHVIDPLAPHQRHGSISFGTANNPYKYSPDMLRTWARIVRRVPGSRFIFIRPEGAAPSFVRNIRMRFEQEGVAADRIEFRPVRGAHMPHYNDVDIALDTFPQTGGTTTCEAAWMGVPTVSLVGEALFERLSFSILSNAGLADLCAHKVDRYIEIAVRLAGDRDRLQTLRVGLRDQIKKSPLGQTRQFASDFYDLIAKTIQEHRLQVGRK